MCQLNTSSVADAASHKAVPARAFYILGAFLLPLGLAGLMTFVVFAAGAVARGPIAATHTDYATIETPSANQTVSSRFVASGEIVKLRDGEVAYLTELVDGKFWPKMRLGKTPGPWKRKQVANGGAGFKYKIVVMAVTGIGEQRIEDWFENGRTSGKYPGLEAPADMRAIAAVRVVKK